MFKKAFRRRRLARQLLKDLKSPGASGEAREESASEPLVLRVESPEGPEAPEAPEGPETPDAGAGRGASAPVPAGTPRKRRRFAFYLKVTAYLFAFVLFLAIGVGIQVFRNYLDDLPEPAELTRYEPVMGAQFLAQDGTVAGERFEFKREFADIAEIPNELKQAVVAIEDSRFYDHEGVDPFGILRAFIRNFQEGRVVQGGSTITQQVVKLIVLTPEKSFERKAREALIALKTEMKYSKDEIMEIYLNQAWFGSNVHGVKAAASFYFDKELGQLTVAECALMAGMLKNANLYSPYRDPERAQLRRGVVLRRMRELGHIDEATYRRANAEPLQVNQLRRRARQFSDAPYFQSWVEQQLTTSPDFVIEDPEPRRITDDDIKSKGFTIRTTLDLGMQRAARESLQEGLGDLEKQIRWYTPRSQMRGPRPLKHQSHYYARVSGTVDGGFTFTLPELPETGVLNRTSKFFAPIIDSETRLDEWKVFEDGYFVRVKALEVDGSWQFVLDDPTHVQGAIVVMDAKTGRVLAMQGGYRFAESPFNRCTQAYRQPGSSFKPILYSMALGFDPAEAEQRAKDDAQYATDRRRLEDAAVAGRMHGFFTPATVLFGHPVAYAWGGDFYEPSNHDPGYGNHTMREALAKSVNIAAVRLLDDPRILMTDLIDHAASLGFERSRLMNHANRTMALGTAECTPLQMAGAYATFANSGIYNEPYFVDRIVDRDGNIIYEHRPKAWRVLSEEDAFLTTSMMGSVVTDPKGTAYTRVHASEILAPLAGSLAGKTGTTNNCTDAWFVGMTPDLVVAVYTGLDEFRSMGRGMYGSRAALPIWIRFMERILANQSELPPFRVPAGIETRTICADTGQLASGFCFQSREEYFRQGTAPTDVCHEHSRERLMGFDAGLGVKMHLPLNRSGSDPDRRGAAIPF